MTPPRLTRKILSTLMIVPAMIMATPTRAGLGDLLVAPTRIILNGSRGTEIILNNIGDDVATYRVSVELRRMRADGTPEDVAAPNAAEIAARDMILYAPRRVTLPPNQPQSIRIAARAPAGLADGEYRVHLLFRAIPPARPADAAAEASAKGIGFSLRPIYGVTIPVIVRLGNLEARAGIANVHLVKAAGKTVIAMDVTRSGSRSIYGDVKVFKPGVAEPIAIQRGVAVYTEIGARSIQVPVEAAVVAQANGPVKVQFFEKNDGIDSLAAETSAVLR